MASQPQPRLTEEQYLEIERSAEFRSEFFNGRMYAMAGGSFWHALIAGNLAYAIRKRLEGKPCRTLTSDMRVRIASHGLYTYPDLLVLCDKPEFADGRTDTLLNPALIAEVLSPSTGEYDRGFEFAQYRAIESLQEYVLVSQRESRVEVYCRQHGGTWLLTESVGLEATCTFASIDSSIPLAELYANVTFDEEQPIR